MVFGRRTRPHGNRSVRLPAHAIYLHWDFAASSIERLEFDITIHSDPGGRVGEYFAPFNGDIAGAQAYGGIQTDVNRPGHGGVGKGAIFSTWWSFDAADLDASDGGFSEMGTHEGKFIGVRRTVDWSVGDWRMSFEPSHGADRHHRRPGNWLDASFSALAPAVADRRPAPVGPPTRIGSLRFPTPARTEGSISPRFVSFLEVYSGATTYSDIADWHLDVMAFGDGVSASSVRTSYPAYPYAEVPNTDAWYDADRRRVHLRFGDETERRHPPGTTPIG